MGRKKITIEPITDERNRHVTFNKRKSGLIKKAMELSILCNCQISFLVFNAENQLFEYCSTDPRLILQQYCKVAHLPHERLSNADYSRFDKASRGTKGGRGKKGQSENSNSIANESSNEMSNQGMPQSMIKQEEMHMPQRRQSISGVSGFMEGHMGGGQQQQQQMMQQPVIQIPQQQYVEQMQRRASISYDPNQLSVQQQQHQQQHQVVSQQLMDAVGLLTPVTPNTVEQVMLNQMNQQQHMMQQHHQQQQQQQEDSPQQIGFHQVQQQLMQQQDQLAAYRTDAATKRKFDQQAAEQEDYPESKRSRMGAHLAPIQVPNNQALPMKRVEESNNEQQQQQQGNENWQQQQHNTGNEGEGFTPLTGGFLFSPIMNNLSTPMAINVGVDWNNAKKDQGST